MDAIQLIQNDHRQIERLFADFDRADRAGERDRQAEVVRQLIRELSIHAAIEEQFVYPALRDGADGRVLDALEEHHSVKLTLAEIQNLSPRSERLGSKIRVLAESVRRHVEEEESELLPLLERTFDPTGRRALAETLERAKRAAPTRPHPAAPDTPPGNFVAGVIAAVIDRALDAMRDGTIALGTAAAQSFNTAFDAVQRISREVSRRSREAADRTVERGREAAAGAMEEVGERAREASARVEVRGTQAAREIGRTGRRASRTARKSASEQRRVARASR